ncbi:MAG TPA: peptidylprolyl isomerase [Flavobacteriales bacterium]
MMNRMLVAATLTLISAAAIAQNKPAAPAAPAAPADPVLMTVDGRPVTRSEFEAIYKKNNKDAPVNKQALDEYLDLFINYKLKVRAAEEAGLDTVAKFRNELDGYRKQLARPYLIDRELNDELMREAYDRLGQEIRASHILIDVKPDATPADTLAAWKRITALRTRVMGGEDFNKVASGKGGSEDPSAEKNGGDLGWFSALQMVYPFETAAFNTPVGQVSQPVRTRFGYHIIKVTDKRPARGEVRVAHIMVRASETDSPEKQAAAEAKIREAQSRVKSGELTFADAALKYSDDDGTSGKGGELPMFGTGKMIEAFEDQAFALKNNDEVGEPFRTPYGWHLVKRLEYKKPPTYEEAKADLKARIARDSRAEITRKKFLTDLRTSYHYKEFPKEIKAVEKMLDSTIFLRGTTVVDTLLRKDAMEKTVVHKGLTYDREITAVIRNGKTIGAHSRKGEEVPAQPTDTVVVRDTQKGWVPSAAVLAKATRPVFTVDGKSFTQSDLLTYLETRQRKEPKQPITTYVAERYKTFVDDKMLEYEDSRLEQKYPDFKLLMKEYRDGILLFELTDQKVWSKAVKDTLGLQSYYDQHKMDYLHPVRFQAAIYTAADAEVSKRMRDQYKKGKRGDELLAAVNKNKPGALTVENGLWSVEEKPFLKGLAQPGLTNDMAMDGKVVVVDLLRVVPAEPKPLNEAKGLVTAAYQDQLEKDWIKELRAKYPVVVEQDVLYSIK